MRSTLLIIFLFIFTLSYGQTFYVQDDIDPKDLVLNDFIENSHQGLKLRKFKYTGSKFATGKFFYQSSYKDFPKNGIVLSTGRSKEAMGPNNSTASNENHVKGDLDLAEIASARSFDASTIEFEFLSLTNSISFQFQFASEEYPEYVNRGVSDIFGFFVTDLKELTTTNIAVLPKNNTPITIDLINENINSSYFTPNYPHYNEDAPHYYETSMLFQFDGFTKTINTGLKLKPYHWYHFKISICDIGDRKFDSWIFLKGNSFISNGKIHTPDSLELMNYFDEDTVINIQKSSDDIFVTTPVFFDFDSYHLNNVALNYINQLKVLLRYSNYNLEIHGFADKIGSKSYNEKLSLNRANSIKYQLVKLGIPEDRISTLGKGEIDSNEGDEKSRKVEFILHQ